MSYKDYIPQNWDEFAVWLANFSAQLPAVAAKYNVSAEAVAQIAQDNEWVQYWVEARNSTKQQKKQLDEYIDEIANKKLNQPQPNIPVWTLPPDIPENVPTGIKKRIREIANGIKNQKSIYTLADGDLLGIISIEGAGLARETASPELKLRVKSNFRIEADFRRFDMNAIKFEARHKGGNWELAAFLNKSPGVFDVVPATPDTAEQIEIRAIYIKDNETFGNYSPNYTVVIIP